MPLLSLVHFGHWDEILAEPQPRADLAYSNAIWRYARGVAWANKGDLKAARAERAALLPLKANEKIMVLDGGDYPASQLLATADNLLRGEIALAGKVTKTAIVRFRAAVAAQDALPYTEPPFWYYPTRQSLGYALLKAGKAAEAQAVYEKDLEAEPAQWLVDVRAHPVARSTGEEGRGRHAPRTLQADVAVCGHHACGLAHVNSPQAVTRDEKTSHQTEPTQTERNGTLMLRVSVRPACVSDAAAQKGA